MHVTGESTLRRPKKYRQKSTWERIWTFDGRCYRHGFQPLGCWLVIAFAIIMMWATIAGGSMH